jgi:type IV secretory pathway TrbL component
VGGVFGEQRANSLRSYINVTSSTSVSGSSCTGSAYGAAKTTDNHTGVSATGSATGGSSNTVNSNTGCAPVSSIACP